MEPDCYLVDVLHYLNPHLIWVKVRNASSDGKLLEQIGIFGVLPTDMVINIEAGDVVKQKSKLWQPAAAMVMRKVLSEAIEVSFQPVYFDRRSSIFDANIHKYGEIYITKADQKRRKLSSYLKKSNFAQYDEEAFYQELRLGHFSTKLSKDRVDAVMKEIQGKLNDNDSEVSFKKQTTIYQTAKKLETLTTENLVRHNKMTENDVLNVLDKKFKDLELCKGLEEESVGRATKRNRLRDLQAPINEADPNMKENINNNNVQAIRNNRVNNAEEPIVTINKNFELKSDTTSEPKSSFQEDESDYRTAENYQYIRRRPTNKNKSPKNKLPECDMLKEKFVAYSPPGIDKSKLPVKVVPIHQQTYAAPRVENEDEVLEAKDDVFGKVDSDIDIKITNKEVLKQYHKGSEDEALEKSKQVVNTPEKVESHPVADDSSSDTRSTRSSRILAKKLRLHNDRMKNCSGSSTISTTTNKDTSSSGDGKTEDTDDEVSEIIEKYKSETVTNATKKNLNSNVYMTCTTNNVNPFKNVDPNLSVFVDKLVNPVLMVHTKNDARIEPKSFLSEIPFNTTVHTALKNMNIQRPMTMQSVSWFTVLRGYSVFLIGPQSSGKTMGYLPSVCRLVSDFDNDIVNSEGPTCVIVCATARSVEEVARKCKMFLDKARMFACYAAMDLRDITMSLLNGCDLLICTPCVLARLLVQTDFGLDLRRLTTLVLDDCERLDVVYRNEIKVLLAKIKEMLKTRVNKEVKVRYIVASRVWCDFMEPLAKKAPNTVVCIAAFQECVLYSKANTSVAFVKEENKVDTVLEFLKSNDRTKKTVVVCRTDKEVTDLQVILKRMRFIVFACNSESLTVEGLRSINKEWNEYSEPLCGPILVCCDGNLSHMNVTDAHYLVHYSMPELFSTFCKRFCVLNEHYPSIFKESNDKVAIKIILEDTNAEQLPKICNFVKRCTNELPTKLDEVCQEILNRKDLMRAENHVPICGNLLGLGECPDFWYCRERHTRSETTDVPKDWVPTEGIVRFKILHYQSAALYSARLLSNVKQGGTKKYPQTYSHLSLKMGMYFSQECNQKLHGVPKVGDVCAASIEQNFYVRCQVVNILNRYRTGNPNHVLIRLIDEERLETTRDIYLYHLPKDMREIETYVVQVRLAGVIPKDKDVTFSELATAQLKKAVGGNDDLYMRGKIALTLGNIIFVENIDVCQDLSSMNEVVVKHNFKELLELHSDVFPEHIPILKSRLFNTDEPKMDTETTNFEEIEEVIPVKDELKMDTETTNFDGLEEVIPVKDEPKMDTETTNFEEIEEVIPVKELIKTKWAHLEKEDMSVVYFTSAIDPGTFFVRLSNFEEGMEALGHDIDKYAEENPTPLTNVNVNDIVLAKYPDDECYERARVDSADDKKANCFFVDHGDWRDVPLKSLIEIPHDFVTRLPFQAIECRLAGIQPLGEDWTDFSTNWLCNQCNGEDLTQLFVQFVSTEKAQHTGGDKYAVVLIDTYGEKDVVYNKLMIELNLAGPREDEIEILNNMDFTKSTEEKHHEEHLPSVSESPETNGNMSLMTQPLRSFPLVPDDDSDSDRWSINMPQEFMSLFRANKTCQNGSQATDTKPKENKATVQEIIDDGENAKIDKVDKKSPASSDVSSVNIDKVSAVSDYEVVAPMKIRVLDSDDSSVSSCAVKSVLHEMSTDRKPKLLWRQNKTTVTIKIMLLGVEEYKIEILDRSVAFSTKAHDVDYKFKIDLYGVVKMNECSHTNKGQAIVVSLVKLMPKNWLSLTKGSEINKWIVYDVDSIDTSSDEEETQDDRAEILKNIRKDDSDSDDGLFDDAVYGYKRH